MDNWILNPGQQPKESVGKFIDIKFADGGVLNRRYANSVNWEILGMWDDIVYWKIHKK